MKELNTNNNLKSDIIDICWKIIGIHFSISYHAHTLFSLLLLI